jgi:myo-inositol 2-dehydrogenase/D-chiro-inositol 1-dehydrogenase
MRMGVIGAGRIGAIHARTAAGLDEVDAVVVADTDVGRAAEVARKLDAEWVDAVDDIWRSGLDAVVIAAPTDVHAELLRACTSDPTPLHADYIPRSGGIFRDCSVHDFDAVRFVTGSEVVSVWATGANKGQPFFAEAGAVDTAAAVLTLADGTLATCTATRYNGAGYDVRLEVCGSTGTLVAGLDEHAPLTPALPGAPAPTSPYPGFLERFGAAYAAELAAFAVVVRNDSGVICTPADALQALLIAEAATVSRTEGRVVELTEVRS